MKCDGRQNSLLTKILVAVFLMAFFSEHSVAADKPDIFVQLGHRSTDVHAAAFSPDGRYLATGSGDLTVKLWDAATASEIRTFTGHTVEVEAVAVSSDGRQVLSGDKKGLIKLWDTVSGREIRSMAFTGKEPGIKALRFSPEARFFTSLTSTTLAVWDADTGNIIRTVENIRGHFSYDRGETYVTAKIGYRDDFVLIELLTGKEIKTFKHADPWFTFASFSQDGKYGLFMKEDYSRNQYFFSLFDMDTGEKISSWERDREKFIHNIVLSRDGRQAMTAGKGGIEMIESRTGRSLKVLTTSYTSFIRQSSNGEFILSSGLYAPALWNAGSGSVVRYFRQRRLSKSSFAEYHPQAKQILIYRTGAPPLLMDSTTGRVNKILTGYTGGYFCAGGRYLMLIGEKNNRLLWNFNEDKAVRKFQGEEVLISKDGKFLTEKISERTLKIWDAATETEMLDYKEPLGKISHFKMSGDNRHLVLCVDNRIKMIDAATGREKHTFVVHDTATIWGAMTSPDGRYLVAICRDDTVYPKTLKGVLKIWETESNREITTIRNVRAMLGFMFSPDGKSVLIGNHTDQTDSLSLIDAATGRQTMTFKGRGIIWEMQFSDDGQVLAAGDADGGIVLWDAFTGREKMTFAAHKNGVRTLKFSPNSRQLVSTGDDGPTRFWDVATGREIAQFISFTDEEWITMTPEGYFNASPNGAKYLNVRVGNQVYSIDNFYEKFFHPVYVASVFQGKKVETAGDIRKGILTPPDIRITSPVPGQEYSADTITVTVAAKDTGGGIDEIRLYHNGKAIGEDNRAVKIVSKGPEIIKEFNVLLVDGDNTFRAVGFSKDRTESNPCELVVKLAAPSKEISLYVLAIGINRYKNPSLNLNYAQPDAKGVADFFKRSGQRLFKKVEFIEIYNEQATKANIVSKLKALRNTNPQDAVLLYLAGHGENISETWYFLPHEVVYPEREEDVKVKGLSSDELSACIKDIKAQKTLVLIDACKSGAALVAFRGFEDRKALSQLSRSIGVHVIAASTKDQFAAEVKELGHGVFTHTLLQGLKGKAAGSGKAITVLKLKAYLDEELPEVTKKYKNEAQYPVADMHGMDFPLTIAQ